MFYLLFIFLYSFRCICLPLGESSWSIIGVVVTSLDLQSAGRRLDSWSQFRAAILGKSFTRTCLCHEAV